MPPDFDVCAAMTSVNKWNLLDPEALVVAATLDAFSKLRFRPADGTFTVLASFALVRGVECKLLSVCTGTKCLPLERLPAAGDALHDSHAEVLARRGALRWCLEEIARSEVTPSRWIVRADNNNAKWTLQPDTQLIMYISMLPCGDASMRHLASQQDPTVAARMSTAEFVPLPLDSASRGRVDYARLGVLRTKPGRVDAPPTACMSCSDKIALWTVCGIQGALGASLLAQPLRIDRIIIGDVPQEHRAAAAEDCHRAFASRLDRDRIGPLPAAYEPRAPRVAFTDAQFMFSRTATGATSSSHESLCWVADSTTKPEVLVDGIRRGLTPRQRVQLRTQPLLSKAALFRTWLSPHPSSDSSVTYVEAKRFAGEYQQAKDALRGAGRPFTGWQRSNTADHPLELFSQDQ
ncbi:hypothetical protein EXIGLDRAFT_827843 [Exidia glandulosa HHB12029]|uniref:A to I editase domain-containing protein n=1 Tax=Exidia glandulosa HHB12029 TaxID=1314781 RepID=A0A165QPL5_EXIGL|nr:hypothetical protein EXIGLDRAFT_827843 [Exidia glandulosa HHB12029]